MLARPALQHRLEHRRRRVQIGDPVHQHKVRRTRQIRRPRHSHLRCIRCNIVGLTLAWRKRPCQNRYTSRGALRRLGPDLHKRRWHAPSSCCIKRNSAHLNWRIIEENYDTVVKYATAIHERTASTEAVLSRFRNAASHPAYQAMLEIGKAQRTIFVARYLYDRDLQRQIESGLNVVDVVRAVIAPTLLRLHSPACHQPRQQPDHRLPTRLRQVRPVRPRLGGSPLPVSTPSHHPRAPRSQNADG